MLVRPAVNVMGKSTIRLNNPKGWYCFRSNVTVAGKIDIEAHCNGAHREREGGRHHRGRRRREQQGRGGVRRAARDALRLPREELETGVKYPGQTRV